MKSLLAQGVSDAFDRARSGAWFGLAMAGCYIGYVVVLYFVSGSAPFEKVHSTLPIVIISYLLLGPIAGGVVGFLLPVASSYIRTIFVAFVASAIVFFGIVVAASGSPLTWHADNWVFVGSAGLMFGIVLGTTYYKKAPRPVHASDEVSELRTVYPPEHRDPEA